MAKCQLCSYPTNDKQMMVNHFRDRHGFSQVEGKGRGTVLRRCIFKGKVPTKGGKIFVIKSEMPSPLRLILNKKNEPVNLQGCKLGNWPIVSKIVSDGDPSNTDQGIVEEEAKLEKHLQDGEEIKKNQEESFYECSECDYASMNEHALFDHVESTHVKVDTEGQSKSSLGMKPNSGVDKNGTNISPFQCDMKANNDSGFNEVVLQYNVGREEPAEVPEPQFMSNEDSDDDLDAFIAVEGTEDSPTLATDLKAHIKEGHVNSQASGGGEGCRDFLPPRTAFKCDLCDYTASGSIGLKYCPRCHVSVVPSSHPPPPDKPISRTGNGKWEWGMGQAAVRDKSKSIPKQKCRQRRDLDNSKERLRRLDEKIHFDLLKDKVPKLKDVNTASKMVILKEATEYARLLGDTALALTKEREREARRNVELRQILASAKMEYFETEIKAENGGADDSGFSSETGEGGLDLNELGANDYIPTVESALTMF